MDNLSGTVVKGYELKECIGAGGFGAVYRAFQPSVGREVAVKVILPQHANQPDFIRRFEVEAQLIARLEHPHIVPLYDYWRDPDAAYLIMRWLPGSLRGAIQRGSWTVEAACQLLEQLAAALTVAHREGIIHRDIKPDNILLDEDANAYLADFGIAKDLSVGNITEEGALVGSPAYITPEQIKGEPVTARADLYSLGLVIYEVLVGEKPYPEATTPIELISRHLNTPLPALNLRRPSLSAALNEVLQTATAKDPGQRYANALRFASAFRAAAPIVQRASDQPLVDPLTKREMDILRLIEAGLSNQEIAEQLVLSAGTVKWYVQQIYSKLDVHSRRQAIERVRQLGLIAGRPHVAVSVRAEDGPAPLAASVTYRPMSEVVNPYKGLRAFQEADAADFFGRAALTEQLLARLSETGDGSRFLAVVGPSGSGKSSVVKAGLIPALRRDALPNSAQWFVTEMLPGTHPFEELEATLLRIAIGPQAGLLDQLLEDRRGLVRVVKRLLPQDQKVELVLLIDQFEELFTLLTDEKVRIHFIDNILSAVTDPRSRVRVILTLRADFYDKPLIYPRLAELVRSHTEVVVPLTQQELERAIRGPAERVGLGLELVLVSAMVNEIGAQAGALPLLQYALTELFERREGLVLTLDAYRSAGGISSALARRADVLYDDLDAAGQAAARQIFMRLTTLGEGTEDTRRRARQAELQSPSISLRALEEVLEAFDRSRLLTFDCDPVTREPTIEIAHEALLHSWGRLREWLDTNRDDLRVHRRLQAAAVEWSGAGRDSSFLASGSRLAQFEALAAATRVVLNHEEIEYVQASTADRERQLATDRERQSRELALAQQAFSAQRSAANRLRYLAVVLIAFLVVAIGLSLFAFDRQASAQANAAESQSLALASAAQVALSKGNTDLALALAVAANRSTQPPALAQRMLFEAAYGPGVKRIFTGHTDAVRGLAMSPDGRFALSASQDKTLILWNVGTGQLIRRFVGHDGNVWSVAFSPDGTMAISGSADKSLILWDVNTGQIIRRFTGHSDEVRAVAISPDGKTALSASYDKLLILWDLSTGQEIRRFKGHNDRVWTVAYSPDGRTMLSGSGNVERAVDNSMRWWDLSTGQEIRRFEGHTDTVRTVAFSPDGTMALSGSFDKTLILWNLQTGKAILHFTGHSNRVLSVAFSRDGRTALSSSADTTLILWDVQTGKPIHEYKGHTDAVPAVVLSPDGRTALSASHDKTLRLWDFQETTELYRLDAEVTNTQVSAAISPDGHLMAVRLRPTDVALYDARTGQLIRRFDGLDPQDPVRLLAFSPDGQSVFVGMQSGTLSLREASTGREIRRFEADDFGSKQYEGQFFVSNLAVSADGRTIALGLLRTVRLFEVATGKELHRFEGFTDWVNCVAFSPDGHYLAAGFGTGTMFDSGSRVDTSVRLWDVSTGQEIRRLTGHTHAVTGVLFSPDGRSIFSSSFDGTLRQWNVQTGQEERRFLGSDSGFFTIALSRDGRYILSGDVNGTVVVWDEASGEPLRQFVLNGSVDVVAFSPDGQTAIGGSQGSLRAWRLSLDLDELLSWTYANRNVRELTCAERDLYRVIPACDSNGQFPTRTPVPSSQNAQTPRG